MHGDMIDARELCKRVVKYVLEGLVVAMAALVLPKQKPDMEAALALGLVAAATMCVVEVFSPNNVMANAVRSGAGMGVGFGLVGFPGGL